MYCQSAASGHGEIDASDPSRDQDEMFTYSDRDPDDGISSSELIAMLSAVKGGSCRLSVSAGPGGHRSGRLSRRLLRAGTGDSVAATSMAMGLVTVR